MEFVFDVNTSGPIFRRGYAEQVIRAYRDEATLKVAGVGKGILHGYLHQFLQHPTGYYESQIAVRQLFGAAVIYDQRVIYGRWLAGVGSRNFPVTRFRGYKHWPLTRADLTAKASEVAEHVLHQYVRRLN
ncbi:hypothetical protein [Nonomuraea sp. GTA35]|uniref:hypothetical protein n=1 Tax=Nonomuraea sp. GTA35 TaxID=1676746 RepID=UPI0035C09FED